MDNITSNNNANFYWWFGVVEDRDDPLRLGRCRVRIIGYHTDDNEVLPTEDLPWALPVMPANSAGTSGVGWSPTGAVEGSWVVGFFADGENGQHPMFFGTVGAIPGGLSSAECAGEDGSGSGGDNAVTEGSDSGAGGDFTEPAGNAKDLESYLEQFLDANGSKIPNYGKMAKAAIMAQCYVETGGFKWLVEQGGNDYFTKEYDVQGRRPSVARQYGNTQPGDGPKYRGRGYIHITWKSNYRYFGEFVGEDLVNNPERAKDKLLAAKAAVYWFTHPKGLGTIYKIAKNNKWADVVAVTKSVNGGNNGLPQRRAAFERYKKKYGVV